MHKFRGSSEIKKLIRDTYHISVHFLIINWTRVTIGSAQKQNMLRNQRQERTQI